MLLFYDIKRDINPLSAHFVPLFGLVALRRKQNTSETSVFSDLRIVNGNEESLVWEWDYWAVSVGVILCSKALLYVESTIFSGNSGILLQTFKDFLFVWFIADVDGILESVLIIDRDVLGSSSWNGIVMLDNTYLIKQIWGGWHNFFDFSISCILINDFSCEHLVLSVQQRWSISDHLLECWPWSIVSGPESKVVLAILLLLWLIIR